MAEKWINGNYAMGKKYKDNSVVFKKKKNVAFVVEEENRTSPWREVVDDYVKHISREHNEEADHLATLGMEGQKNTLEGVANTEEWKTIRSGIVIKAVDRDKWITVSNIAVTIKRMYGHGCGDYISQHTWSSGTYCWTKSLNSENINECIEKH